MVDGTFATRQAGYGHVSLEFCQGPGRQLQARVSPIESPDYCRGHATTEEG